MAVLIPCSCPASGRSSGGPSGRLGPAENGGHLLITHTLLPGDAHGPAQINGQDVFALEEKSTGGRLGDATLRVAGALTAFSWLDGQEIIQQPPK